MPATTPSKMRRASGRLERPEAQRVQQRNRPGAHGEDVADDAADAGGGALVGLDERGMVVRLDLEDGAQPVADVHRAGVLARSLDHARAGGRQRLQVHARALVAAVLGPHHREQAELQQVGLAAHELADAIVLVGLEAVALEDGGVDDGHADTREPARPWPARPTRGRRGHRRCPARPRRRARDAASARRRCAPVADAGDVVDRAVGVAASGVGCPARPSSGRSTWRLASSSASTSGRRSSCPRRARSAGAASGPARTPR